MKTLSMLAVVAGLGLAACAQTPKTVEAQPGGAQAGGALTACKAEAYQTYVGKARSLLPAQPAGANWRVVCSTCAVTMDYRPDRMTVTYDTDTNIIKDVKCG